MRVHLCAPPPVWHCFRDLLAVGLRQPHVAKFISDDRTDDNNANYQDRELDKLFDAMNRSGDPEEQRRIMRKFEKRALDEQAHMFITSSWWYRIIPHRSIVRGWKISPGRLRPVKTSSTGC